MSYGIKSAFTKFFKTLNGSSSGVLDTEVDGTIYVKASNVDLSYDCEPITFSLSIGMDEIDVVNLLWTVLIDFDELFIHPHFKTCLNIDEMSISCLTSI